MNLDGHDINAVRLTITNSTTSTLYLTNLRLKSKDINFAINRMSARDFYTGYYELKFFDHATEQYSIRNMIIHTDGSEFTVIGLEHAVDDNLFIYRPNFWSKFFRCYHYFIIEYTALVGNKRYLVKTRF